MTSLDDAIDAYFNLRMGGLAASKVKADRNQMKRVHRWLTADLGRTYIHLDYVDADLKSRYLATIDPPQLSASSYNNYRQYIRLFFDFCQAEGWMTTNPARHSRPARGRKRTKLWLRPEQVTAMMDGVGPRDRFAIALGFNTALRAADVASLTVGAIDLYTGYTDATIQKTQDRIRLPVTQDLANKLERWLLVYLESTGGDGRGNIPQHWLLVPSIQPQAINVHKPELDMINVYREQHPLKHPERVVHRGLAALQVQTFGEGFHTLRRSAARNLLDVATEAGARNPIRIVQAQPGHRSRDTAARGRRRPTWA